MDQTKRATKAEALAGRRSLNPRPEAVRDDLFATEEFFDARDMVQVKYEMVRRARVEGEPAVVVGGLQGPASAYKREIIDATRDLYGLRPKDAALLAARAFARALGFNVLHAVCDANHVLGRLQDTAKFSRYDDYWLERGGERGGPFGFVFGPLEATAPSGDRRDATKAAVVAGMEAFVAAHRAPRRPPDGDLCAPPDLRDRPSGVGCL